MKKIISDPAILGEEFDCLASGRPPSCDPLFCSRVPAKKSAVVVTMRNEGASILEWVSYQRVLGFDTIIVYTNQNSDGSENLLRSLHFSNVIQLIDNPTPIDKSPQWKAYRHAFWFSEDVADHEWVCFIDADEFIVPLFDGEFLSINAWIDRVWQRFNSSSILLNWRWFPGDAGFEMTDGLLIERFRKALWSDQVKSVFKLRDAVDFFIHYAEMKTGTVSIGDAGQIIERPSPSVPNPTGALGRINHYWNKSFQEFYIKRERGRGAGDRAPRNWTSFFTWGRGEVCADPYPPSDHI